MSEHGKSIPGPYDPAADTGPAAALYNEWWCSDGYADECEKYGDERAAFFAGAAAERERIRQLAIKRQATYWIGPDDHPAPRRPFALLIQFGEEEEGDV